MSSKRKPTATDAELIMKLYELRREPVMRQARQYMVMEFWPKSYEDVVQILSSFGGQENAYLRQIASYWEMACSFVLAGVLDEDLFFESSGEMYNLFAKLKPHLKRIRERFNVPEAFANLEKVCTRTAKARARVAIMEQRLSQLAAAKTVGR